MIDEKHFREVLETEKAKLEEYISELNKLRNIVGRYDGKIYDKRIREAIRQEGFRVCNGGKSYSLIIYGNAYKSDASLFWARDKEAFCDGKRFSSAKFRKQLWGYIQKSREKLAGIEADLIDTEQKLYNLHQAAKYYAEQVKGLSNYTQHKFERTLELTIFKMNYDY